MKNPLLKGLAASIVLQAAWVAIPATAAELVSRCGTIRKPGAYQVERNLDAVGDCLVVDADFASIDLGGHVLRGDGRGTGVSMGTSRQVTVRNGTVTGFANGIALMGGVVEGVNAIDNDGTGILVVGGIVRDSVATGNVSSSNDSGIVASGRSTIVGNTVYSNRLFGIAGSSHSTVANNTVTFGDEIGITVNCPAAVHGNTAVGNGIQNLRLWGADCVAEINAAP